MLLANLESMRNAFFFLASISSLFIACSGQVAPGGAASSSSALGCARTTARLTISASGDFAPTASDGGMGTSGPRNIETTMGTLTSVSPTTFTLDTCSPRADCAGKSAVFEVSGGGVDLSPIATARGGFVQVDLMRSSTMFGTVSWIMVKTVDAWGDVPSAKVPPPPGTMLLAAAEGTTGGFDSAPFTIDRVPLHCGPDSDTEGHLVGQINGSYLLRFKDKSTKESIDVTMGETKLLGRGWQGLTLHNLRSYQSAGLDDDWNWAFWAVVEPGI